MPNASDYGPRSAASDDGAWGPSTSFSSTTASSPSRQSGSGRSQGGPPALPQDRRRGRDTPRDHHREIRHDVSTDPRDDAYWTQPGDVDHTGSARQRLAEMLPANRAVKDRGLPAWGALLVLLAIAAVGGIVDAVTGSQSRSGFNIGIVVASLAAILLVRRSAMFPVVIAPPIVYSVASGVTLYVRSGGLNDRKVLIDSAANWLVYGFPAIAAATAAVLIIAGIRLIARR